MDKTVGQVSRANAAAIKHLLRTWEAVPAVVRLELREVAPELVPALDEFAVARLSLLAVLRSQGGVARDVADVADLTARAHAIAAVHEGMPPFPQVGA